MMKDNPQDETSSLEIARKDSNNGNSSGPQPSGIFRLPAETFKRIYAFLDPSSLWKAAQVSRAFYHRFNDHLVKLQSLYNEGNLDQLISQPQFERTEPPALADFPNLSRHSKGTDKALERITRLNSQTNDSTFAAFTLYAEKNILKTPDPLVNIVPLDQPTDSPIFNENVHRKIVQLLRDPNDPNSEQRLRGKTFQLQKTSSSWILLSDNDRQNDTIIDLQGAGIEANVLHQDLLSKANAQSYETFSRILQYGTKDRKKQIIDSTAVSKLSELQQKMLYITALKYGDDQIKTHVLQKLPTPHQGKLGAEILKKSFSTIDDPHLQNIAWSQVREHFSKPAQRALFIEIADAAIRHGHTALKNTVWEDVVGLQVDDPSHTLSQTAMQYGNEHLKTMVWNNASASFSKDDLQNFYSVAFAHGYGRLKLDILTEAPEHYQGQALGQILRASFTKEDKTPNLQYLAWSQTQQHLKGNTSEQIRAFAEIANEAIQHGSPEIKKTVWETALPHLSNPQFESHFPKIPAYNTYDTPKDTLWHLFRSALNSWGPQSTQFKQSVLADVPKYFSDPQSKATPSRIADLYRIALYHRTPILQKTILEQAPEYFLQSGTDGKSPSAEHKQALVSTLQEVLRDGTLEMMNLAWEKTHQRSKSFGSLYDAEFQQLDRLHQQYAKAAQHAPLDPNTPLPELSSLSGYMPLNSEYTNSQGKRSARAWLRRKLTPSRAGQNRDTSATR